MNSLDGKVALLSGAARGIGAETARKMAAAGASVVLGDVLADRVRETAKEITGEGGNALALSLDVTTEASWTAAVATATKQFGKLDILVNNAGIFLGKDLMDATIEDWSRLVAINMTGVWLGASDGRKVHDRRAVPAGLAALGERGRAQFRVPICQGLGDGECNTVPGHEPSAVCTGSSCHKRL
jgi:NAD(P)-dependent dehydrogenase (short-subunit alcohol dehydrogenase family)